MKVEESAKEFEVHTDFNDIHIIARGKRGAEVRIDLTPEQSLAMGRLLYFAAKGHFPD